MLYKIIGTDSLVLTHFQAKHVSQQVPSNSQKVLHFENSVIEIANDRKWKMRDMLSDLNVKYKDFYVPSQKLVIDKLLLLFKRVS